MLTLCGRCGRWGELPAPRRARWEALAEKDQQRYDREKVISSALRSSCVGEVKLQT